MKNKKLEKCKEKRAKTQQQQKRRACLYRCVCSSGRHLPNEPQFCSYAMHPSGYPIYFCDTESRSEGMRQRYK